MRSHSSSPCATLSSPPHPHTHTLSVSFPCSLHTLSQCNAARFLTDTHTTLFLALSHSLCLSRSRTPQHKGKSTRAQCRYTGCLARTRRYVRARSLSLRFGCRACTAIFSLFPQTNVINCKQENFPPAHIYRLPPHTHTLSFGWKSVFHQPTLVYCHRTHTPGLTALCTYVYAVPAHTPVLVCMHILSPLGTHLSELIAQRTTGANGCVANVYVCVCVSVA